MESLACIPACRSHLFPKLVSPNRINKPPGKKTRVSNWQFLFLAWALICVPFLKPCPTLGAPLPFGGKIVYVQGDVKVRTASGPEWVPAKIDQSLYHEDAVKTGPLSRAAILCVDESQIKLNENTLFILKTAAQSSRLKLGEVVPAAVKEILHSLYIVPQGEIWLRNSNEKFRFELETPAVTAGIRGTELNIQVSPDGTTRLVLLHGALSLENPLGRIDLNPGEEGFARPGQAPTKRVLLTPADAVQWSLYYPGIFSYRDLPLSTSTASPLDQEAVTAYNQGNLKSARQAAENALARNPRDPHPLTVLGWVSLQRHALEEAEGFFRRVQPPTAMSAIGLALACYRRGDVVGAYTLSQKALKTLPPFSSLTAMAGYFALLAGRVAEARGLLEQARQQGSVILAPSFLAQMNLVQNRKIAAQEQAAQALAQGPDSPQALLTQALVEIARFDLPKARHHLENALKSDPGFIQAYVYLARLWMGSDYLDRARYTIETALNLAPYEAEVLSMAGFIRLGYRDYQAAREYFNRAAAANPSLGDPHLGLGHVHFRYRNFPQGLAEILSATLLEPRVSLYQSFMGKALYQMRAFDKALETYDYAKTLDPKDPTPYLYKGIALTDLNRPGEAIIEINRSIELNDNRAVFRSRLGLDRDLAVRNYNLAYAYNNLGLGDWAYSKAITAVQNDPTNSSAQLFLARAFVGSSQRVGAASSAALLYKLLSPANQNTFSESSIDYTPMFEMPYGRLAATATGGLWDSRTQTIQDYFLRGYGGWPGVAGEVRAAYSQDEGYRRSNSDSSGRFLSGLFKWDVKPKTSLFFQGSYQDSITGDDLFRENYHYQNRPFYRYAHYWRMWEGGFVHKFTPEAIFLAYMNYQRHSTTVSDFAAMRSNSPYIDGPLPWVGGWYYNAGFLTMDTLMNSREINTLEIFNPQAQQMLIWKKHTFLLGGEYFRGKGNYTYADLFTFWYRSFTANMAYFFDPAFNFLGSLPWNPPLVIPLNNTYYSSSSRYFGYPEWSYCLYLLDYWRPTDKLLLELGVTYEANKTTYSSVPRSISRNLWSPRLGINYFITPQQVVRLSAYTALSSLSYQNSLMPSQVAGMPYDSNAFPGAEIREAGASWEAQWTPKTFTMLKAGAIRVANEWYASETDPKEYLTWKEYYASMRLNQIVRPFLGLNLGGQWKKVQLNYPYPYYVSYHELDGLAGLSFWHQSGLRASLSTTLIYQKPNNLKYKLFGMVDAGVGYEFPQKRGLIYLTVKNIFNRHFTYLTEPISLDTFSASRQITLRCSLYL